MHTIPDWASRSMNEKRKKNEPPAQVQTNEKGIEDKPVFTLSIHNKMKERKKKEWCQIVCDMPPRRRNLSPARELNHR